jgi:hypothetical protein
MTVRTLETPRFIRKTQLAQGEYRRNFHQIDNEIIETITSREADQVTPLMSKIYLRLVGAPTKYWERDGVLRFEADFREEARPVKAWTALCELLGVASATACKALRWLHEVGVIGYFAGKNGVGIRIFLNRAASSIGTRPTVGGQNILAFAAAARAQRRASPDEAASNDSFAVRELSDSDLNPCAPQTGADKESVAEMSPAPTPACGTNPPVAIELQARPAQAEAAAAFGAHSMERIVSRLRCEFEPMLQSAAAQAARREHERTRQWLEQCGIPKAARVAQREAYNVLRSHGVLSDCRARARGEVEVGRSQSTPVAKPLSAEQLTELAGMCMAMLDVHGQAIDVTLAEMSADAGGCLLAEEAPGVRKLAMEMAAAMSTMEHS